MLTRCPTGSVREGVAKLKIVEKIQALKKTTGIMSKQGRVKFGNNFVSLKDVDIACRKMAKATGGTFWM